MLKVTGDKVRKLLSYFISYNRYGIQKIAVIKPLIKMQVP